MITYIIQVVLFQVLFLAVYDFFLSKETFHKYNRWYLLGTPIISFVLPLIKIPTLQKAVPEEIMIFLPEIMLSPQSILEQTSFYTEGSINYLSLVFWLGVVLCMGIFLVKLFKIGQLILKNETINKVFYKLVLLPQKTNAFSFFNFIFLGKEISKEKQEQIIEHELIHSKQKHSLDLLFFELLRVVMWFNPMIYFYQQRITLLHEYITDSEVVKTTEKHDYFNNLLAQTFQVENISFVNQFYKHSLIKKRITMMTKNKSKQIKKAKYLLLLPLLASMLLYTSCEKNQMEEIQTVAKKETQVRFVELRGEVKKYFGKKETFTDNYIGTGIPEGVLISYHNLSETERKEYDVYKEKIHGIKYLDGIAELVLYRKNNGRVTIADIIDFSKMKRKIQIVDLANNTVPLSIIEEVPVYPGCENGSREERINCLNEKTRNTFQRNFNVDLTKNLGLSKGEKKIVIFFKINEAGEIVDINARAPHPILKKEALRVASLLPKMKPGRQRGKTVGVKYTLPISFVVE